MDMAVQIYRRPPEFSESATQRTAVDEFGIGRKTRPPLRKQIVVGDEHRNGAPDRASIFVTTLSIVSSEIAGVSNWRS